VSSLGKKVRIYTAIKHATLADSVFSTTDGHGPDSVRHSKFVAAVIKCDKRSRRIRLGFSRIREIAKRRIDGTAKKGKRSVTGLCRGRWLDTELEKRDEPRTCLPAYNASCDADATPEGFSKRLFIF